MDGLVQLLREIAGGPESLIHFAAAAIDGYNNNPGGDFRDFVTACQSFFERLGEILRE